MEIGERLQLSESAQLLLEVRASIEVIRALCTLAWQLRWLSHGALALLSDRLDPIGRQTTRWQQWFEDKRQ